jgi:hypothetical protein
MTLFCWQATGQVRVQVIKFLFQFFKLLLRNLFPGDSKSSVRANGLNLAMLFVLLVVIFISLIWLVTCGCFLAACIRVWIMKKGDERPERGRRRRNRPHRQRNFHRQIFVIDIGDDSQVNSDLPPSYEDALQYDRLPSYQSDTSPLSVWYVQASLAMKFRDAFVINFIG